MSALMEQIRLSIPHIEKYCEDHLGLIEGDQVAALPMTKNFAEIDKEGITLDLILNHPDLPKDTVPLFYYVDYFSSLVKIVIKSSKFPKHEMGAALPEIFLSFKSETIEDKTVHSPKATGSIPWAEFKQGYTGTSIHHKFLKMSAHVLDFKDADLFLLEVPAGTDKDTCDRIAREMRNILPNNLPSLLVQTPFNVSTSDCKNSKVDIQKVDWTPTNISLLSDNIMGLERFVFEGEGDVAGLQRQNHLTYNVGGDSFYPETWTEYNIQQWLSVFPTCTINKVRSNEC